MADPASTLSIILVLCGLLMLWVLHSSGRWDRASKSGARLPKGSFSWPIIGDTLAFAQDPITWGISQEKRYGKIFKASVFFRKTIAGTTPEFAKFVLQSAELFNVQYPKNLQFIAPNSIFLHDGLRHLAVKKLFTKTVALPESLQAMFKILDGIVLENLALWERKSTVNGSDACERLVADTASYVALGVNNIRSTPQGILALENLVLMSAAISSLPVNLPGFTYNKGLKARAAFRSYIRDVLERKRSQQGRETTIIQALLEAQKDAQAEGAAGFDLDDETIIDEVIGTWFAAYRTSATTLTWALKFLVDYPNVFSRIQAEHQTILEGKDLSIAGSRLTWEDAKKMVYTTKFFHEVQRILSLSHTIPRRAVQDIVYDGFLIPKGWQVFPMISSVQLNHANYPDPFCFNPDRFDVPPKPHTYLPFGTGPHRCPGEEVAKLVTVIFIHYLTTTYTYEPLGPDLGKSYKVFPIINGGYPINVRRRI